MTIIEEVHREREDLARVLKKHPGIRKIVEDLYPDSAHFIYELLQNAEDTGATEAQFTLAKACLVFEHNGRPFEPKDIYAITDIGEGTKANDDDKIGRFGVGFKAVFAYSESPHIWSPSFSFKITDLVLPSELESKAALGSKTRFEFPFNNPKKIASTAYDEVNAGLKELVETTLLFLSHLESIRWQNATSDSGEILRIRHPKNHFEVRKQAGGKISTSSHFLKFNQPVAVAGLEKQRVAVAYELDFLPKVQNFDPKKTLAKQLKIIPATLGQVAVFFPAEKETSGLRFHLHAPFVPELSRASIKETDANLPLFQQLATLTAASLHQVRDLGLLTADFLSVLPNPQDSIPARYQDIRKAIVEEMTEQPLTPTYAKTHAPAKYLYQAKASLKELLSNDDIAILVDYDDEPPQWASARALNGTNIEQFMTGLAITDWDVEQFADLLNKKASVGGRSIPYSPYHTTEPDAEFMTWLSGKPVEWHQEMYVLLHSDYLPRDGWQKDRCINKLKSLRIVRLSNNGYSVGPKCYFPSDGAEQNDVLPRVDVRTYTTGKKKGPQESAKKFLEEIGVREVGEAEQVEAILEQRYMKTNLKPLKKDLVRFIALLEKEPDKASLFTSHWIFESANGKWSQPGQVFIDKPFMDTGLSAYYDAFGENAKRVALADSYKDYGIADKRLVKFAEAVGAQTRLEVSQTNCSTNPHKKWLYSVGGNQTITSINRDYVIAGLEKILAAPSLPISKLIWQCMCSLPQNPDRLKAIYQNNRSTGSRDSDSTLVHQLRAAAWVPQGDSAFARPADATRDLLPEGFPFDPGWPWLKAIHFGEEAVKKSEVYRQKQTSAQALGFESADQASKWAELDKLGVSPDELLAKHKKRDLPNKESPNPERRAEKVADEARSTPEKTRETRERTIDPDYGGAQGDAKTYLKHQYTNADGVMFCQLCQDSQPVMLNGVPYFEAVTCVSDINTHHEQNNLALCPNHAAMYKNSNLTPDAIQQAILECESQKIQTIPMNLAGNKKELYFTQQHLGDLCAALTALDTKEI